MLEVGRTWIVLLRNVSHAVRVAGEDQLMAALVLHAETGLVLGVSISGTAAEALAGAFASALANPAADLPPAPPARVVSLVEIVPEVRKAIAAASFGSPELIEARSIPEAEDIFDSLVGQWLAGLSRRSRLRPRTGRCSSGKLSSSSAPSRGRGRATSSPWASRSRSTGLK